MSNVLILGATSAIAQAVAREYAQKKSQLFLVGRDLSRLKTIASDLTFRGASRVQCYSCDFLNFENVKESVKTILSDMKTIDLVLLAYGFCPPQKECETHTKLALRTLETNLTSPILWLLEFIPFLEKQKFGTFAIISSVAGDRGRKSNFVYGSSKGGLSLFCEGFRNRLKDFGIQVLLVKPGFVDTPMTQNIKKNRWFVSPEKIAKDIVKAVERKKRVLYTPWYWRWVMLGVRNVPQWLAERLAW